MTTITIKTPEAREVAATLIKGTSFAIHRPYGHRESWTLTHVPTGWRVAGAWRRDVLRRLARRLTKQAIDWTSTDADMLSNTRDVCLPIIREETRL